jgi:hypothetical protein
MTETSTVSAAVLDQFFNAAGRWPNQPWPKTLELLLDQHKGLIHATDSQRQMTALGHASLGGHADAVTVLLRRGADVNKLGEDTIKSGAKQRPLFSAAGGSTGVAALAGIPPLCARLSRPAPR